MERTALERIAAIIVDGALRVHKALGPGLLESVYEACLAHELRARGLSIVRQVELPVDYGGVRLDAGYRIDILVEGCIVIERKAVERLLPGLSDQLQRSLAPRRHQADGERTLRLTLCVRRAFAVKRSSR